MIQKLKRPDGTALAYERIGTTDANKPTLIFCGGFRSDMEGGKALAVCDFARQNNLSAIRFDYFAHGQSDGDFAHGSIGRWLDDTLAIVDEVSTGPVVLIGSSMGGWIATIAAEERPDRVVGLQLLAAAPDFTRRLMWAEMPPHIQEELMTDGLVEVPNDYSDEPYEIHRKLIVEADEQLMLHRKVNINCPVRLIHGLKDTDVPWQLAQELMEQIASDDIEMTLVKNGDHRLSSDADLARLLRSLTELLSLT